MDRGFEFRIGARPFLIGDVARTAATFGFRKYPGSRWRCARLGDRIVEFHLRDPSRWPESDDEAAVVAAPGEIVATRFLGEWTASDVAAWFDRGLRSVNAGVRRVRLSYAEAKTQGHLLSTEYTQLDHSPPPPVSERRIDGYVVPLRYRRYLFEKYPDYTAEEILGTMLGYDEEEPSYEEWLRERTVDNNLKKATRRRLLL